MNQATRKQVVSALREQRDKLQSELNGIVAALGALGETVGTGSGKATVKRTAVKRGSASGHGKPVAAIDANAVKRGVATPEQCKRYAERKGLAYNEVEELNAANAAKRGAGAKGTTSTSADAPEPLLPAKGANLAAAADGA